MENSAHRHQALEDIRAKLPETFTRNDVAALLPGIISVFYLARLDSMGKGPDRFKILNRVHYRRDSFVDWLAQR